MSHGWSVNQTITYALQLLVAVRIFDDEDQKTAAVDAQDVLHRSGRLYYQGRSGEKREFGHELLSPSMSTRAE